MLPALLQLRQELLKIARDIERRCWAEKLTLLFIVYDTAGSASISGRSHPGPRRIVYIQPTPDKCKRVLPFAIELCRSVKLHHLLRVSWMELEIGRLVVQLPQQYAVDIAG